MKKHPPRAAAFGTLAWVLTAGALMTSTAAESVACGYHDDVALARGALNWAYPDALHVVGAISTAVAGRRLPAGTSARTGIGFLGYHATVRVLEQHARQLRMQGGETPRPAFALVLVEPMLWTRFTPEDGDRHLQAHVSGPQTGDLVVVSGEEVIRAIVDARLTVGEAWRSGLLRLYGTDEQIRSFLTIYDGVGGAAPAQ
jgi:hypothetical protein